MTINEMTAALENNQPETCAVCKHVFDAGTCSWATSSNADGYAYVSPDCDPDDL
jgi:hypothetical protein